MALPFQFEPEYKEDEMTDYDSCSSVEDYEETEVHEDRLSKEVSSWCCCGECQTIGLPWFPCMTERVRISQNRIIYQMSKYLFNTTEIHL